ncbi:MAG: hypothetical protein JNL32_12830, partial [Candidatus Kapabacteria bacterium]|nr:hypothetical protein [Candidatus Kapabacteria bacterium]
MKKRVFLAAVAALCIASVSAWSQVYVEFAAPTKQGNRPYTPIPAGTGTTILTASNFVTTPSVDPDNGFAVVTLPFTFEFNAVQYTNVAINVNGFIMFLNSPQPPLGLVGMEIPTRMFDGQQFPRNVVAPFWGDHFFRVGGFAEPGYMPSQVLTRQVTIGGRSAFCIEWRNLNINDKTLPSSVANFQVLLYQQTSIPGNFQGDIEFAYGQIGGNTNTPLTTVITRNASVGMKGASGSATIQADWINGLEFSGTQAARTSTRLTNSWQPSGGSDTVIVFIANPRIRLDVWGDGDADFSQAPGQRHNNNGNPIPNRFVTANDALRILRSAATNVPLDSVFRTQAYKGDVDHNGRYYYSRRNSTNTLDTLLYKREVRFRTASNDHTMDMPIDNSLDYSLIYFQVNAYDAALIMHYLAGRITQLPWTIDSIVPFGKVNPIGRANNITIGNVINAGTNTYRVPVYANGLVNGAVSAVFEMNGTVVNVETVNPESVIGMYNNNRVAIAGTTKTD